MAWPWAHCSAGTGPLSTPTRSIPLAAGKMPPSESRKPSAGRRYPTGFAALEGFAGGLRLATLLPYFGRGHSYAQIGLLCDVPVGTVRNRPHQAKADLG